MSFNYPSLNGNGLPTMLPLITNLANGGNFLSTLAPNQAANLLAAHHQSVSTAAALSENPLDFNRTHTKLCQAPGAGPMDLETLNDDRLQSPTGNDLNLQRKLSASADDGSDNKNFTTFNPVDVMYNMGIPSQNLMNIMPNVLNMIRDTTSMVQTIPQFSLINHQLPIQSTATTTLTEPNLITSTASTSSSTNSTIIAKETITCKSCILLPPNPNAAPPSTRERPKGCRTVFVGGLPENITEEIIREVFEPCGEITTLRLSKKNFCHIRFVYEASVDSAIYLSGYRIRIKNQGDSSNCGRLHVDFAQARDDQYEYECKQRQLQREQRHRERIERDRLRPMSPPCVVHFSEHEASTVSERLKQDETFLKAVQILATWLERGDCNKKNSNTFYSMIQSTNSHVRRLLNEKTTYEDELNKAKEMHRKHMQCLSTQLSQIEKVFGAASHKKVWDHFTKAQRKNIDLWKKQSLEVHVPPEALESHDSDEMEMSDDDDDTPSNWRHNKRSRRDSSRDAESRKSDSSIYSRKPAHETSPDVKDQQLKMLQETIRNLQTQLLENKTKERENLTKIHNLELKLKRLNAKELMRKPKSIDDLLSDQASSDSDRDVVCVDDVQENVNETNCNIYTSDLNKSKQFIDKECNVIDGDEAHLIGLLSAFLIVYPFGASLDVISTYIREISMELCNSDIEIILKKYKNIFCEMPKASSTSDDVQIPKWKFSGFEKKLNSTTKSTLNE